MFSMWPCTRNLGWGAWVKSSGSTRRLRTAFDPEKIHNSSSTGTSSEKNNCMLGSFRSNQTKKDAVALHEAEVSRSCGSCNKSIRASPMVLSMWPCTKNLGWGTGVKSSGSTGTLLWPLKKCTTAVVLELPLRRTAMCWDHFKATKKKRCCCSSWGWSK